MDASTHTVGIGLGPRFYLIGIGYVSDSTHMAYTVCTLYEYCTILPVGVIYCMEYTVPPKKLKNNCHLIHPSSVSCDDAIESHVGIGIQVRRPLG